MQTPNKKQMFLDMQEHPEKYSEEQIETMMDELDQVPDVDIAWQAFELKQMPTAVRSSHRWIQIAAIFIGVLMLSGITYAAIHIISHRVETQVSSSSTSEAAKPSAHQQTIQTDSIQSNTIPMEPKLYDNVPMEQMLAELSTYYNIKVEYRTEAARKIRLFYQWKPDYSIEKVVEMLNNFDWLQLELKGDTLFVSSSIEPQP